MFLDGAFAGGLGDGLKILQDAPIGTGETFAGWEGAGDLQGKLKLDIPLDKGGDQPKILVDFKTANARLKLAEPKLELTQLKGDFRFDSAKGLSGQNIAREPSTNRSLRRFLPMAAPANSRPGSRRRGRSK